MQLMDALINQKAFDEKMAEVQFAFIDLDWVTENHRVQDIKDKQLSRDSSDFLQLTANYSVATPANWKQGEDCIVSPSIATADIPDRFPKGHEVIKPYLRTTPQPDL